MKVIGCRDIEIDCPWETAGEHEDAVLHELAQHAIDVHKVWPEDGPIQTWERVRAAIREVEPPTMPDATGGTDGPTPRPPS